jgi:hypothetical protein
LLHAIDAERAHSGEGRQEDVLDEDAILLASHEDLAGEEEHGDLAAIVDNQLGDRRLCALRDEERSRSPRFVEGGDVELRWFILRGEPESQERCVSGRRPHAHREQPAGEIAVGLSPRRGLMNIGGLAENPSALGRRTVGKRNRSDGAQRLEQELPASTVHVPLPRPVHAGPM